MSSETEVDDPVLDECGVCGGNGESCLDCGGNVNGHMVVDECGTCQEGQGVEAWNAGMCVKNHGIYTVFERN